MTDNAYEDVRLQLAEEMQNAVNCACYFQPPENLKLTYPCIIYSLNDVNVVYASDGPYIELLNFEIIYITKDPLPKELQTLVYVLNRSCGRTYVADNLHHFVFNVTRTSNCR